MAMSFERKLQLWRGLTDAGAPAAASLF